MSQFPNTTRVAQEAGPAVLKRMDSIVRSMISTQSKIIREADSRLGAPIWDQLYSNISGRTPENIALIMEDRIRRAMEMVKAGTFQNDRESMVLLACMDLLVGFMFDHFYKKLSEEQIQTIDDALQAARRERMAA